MSPETLKSIASLLVALMTFLGWNINDYQDLIPINLKPYIVTTPTTVTKEPQTPPKVESRVPTPKPPQSPAIPSKPVTVIKTPTPKPEVPAPISTLSPKSEDANQFIKNRTVNILCSRPNGSRIYYESGSGVIIDKSGVVLTNAHVAEHILLEQAGKESCFIRTGSPAQNSYKAKIIFLPSVWIENNKDNLTIQNPTGTGENDFALLALTERVSKQAPNIPLPYFTIGETIEKNSSVHAAGYPIQFQDVSLLQSALYLLIESSTISNLATFGGNTVDVVNTDPTPVAEHGSSGGPVIDKDNNLIAIIVATTVDSYSGKKNIQAITLPYIKRATKNLSGKSFETLIGNAGDEINNFANDKVKLLSGILLANQ